MKKGTFQPHVIPRRRKIGFLARSASPSGRKVLRNRRRKGRKYLTRV
ncbi:MAG: 50S ribosomal protein L34 [Synergistaceae bacterium]|nr:50S ribosomal protein L34 [Synergistaceae bacterium]